MLVQQRDNELALLVSLIKKKGGEGADLTIPVKRSHAEEDLLRSVVKEKPMVFKDESQVQEQIREESMMAERKMESTVNPSAASRMINESEMEEIKDMLIKPVNLTTEQMMDEAKAFDEFRRSYRRHEAMQKNMVLLEEKMAKGKEMGRRMNEIRSSILKRKEKLEEIKRQNAVNSLV